VLDQVGRVVVALVGVLRGRRRHQTQEGGRHDKDASHGYFSLSGVLVSRGRSAALSSSSRSMKPSLFRSSMSKCSFTQPFASSLLILPSLSVSSRLNRPSTRSAASSSRAAFRATGSILPFLPVSSL